MSDEELEALGRNLLDHAAELLDAPRSTPCSTTIRVI